MKNFWQRNKEYFWMGIAAMVVLICFYLIFTSSRKTSKKQLKKAEITIDNSTVTLSELNVKIDSILQMSKGMEQVNNNFQIYLAELEDANKHLLNKFRDTRHEYRRQINLLMEVNQELQKEKTALEIEAKKLKRYED